MNILTKKTALLTLSALPLALLAAGCADDSSDYVDPKTTEPEYAMLESVYPTAHVSTGEWSPTLVLGQEEGIPTTAAAVYHFDRSVSGLEPLKHIEFVWKREVVSDRGNTYKEDVPIEFSTEFRNGGRTLVVIPDEELVPFREYEVYVPLKRQDTYFDREYSSFFTAGTRWEGTPEETSLATGYFRSTDLLPSMSWYNHDIGSKEFPVFPNSSLTMEFTQPVDPSTVRYGSDPGDNIRLVERLSREPLDLDVDVIVSGRYVTLDPLQDLPEGGEISIDLAPEGDPDAIQSVTGMLAQPSGGLTFGTTGEAGVDYEVLSGWPSSITLRPEDSRSDFTTARTNSVIANGEVLTLADEDLSVEMVSIPEEISFADRTFFTIKRSDRGPGERRLAILSDAYGYVNWATHDRHADKWAYDKVKFFADIGVLDENGNVVSSGRAEFHGEAYGDPREGNLILDLVSSTDPAAFGQDRLPGNGLINLKFRMTGAEE